MAPPPVGAVALYSGPDETGQSFYGGLCPQDRYLQIPNSVLSAQGLINSVASGEMHSALADLNLVLFSNSDYSGTVLQLSVPRVTSATFWHTGSVNSALLIASNNAGTRELRVSFVDQMRDKWKKMLDDQLQGSQVSRDVDPLLTWTMYPSNNQWLSSTQTYLRIHQPLHVHMPWYWSDYQASMDYNIVLYINGDRHLRSWVADWEYWVEGGAKSDTIADRLRPKVQAGTATLEDQLNTQLAGLDALGEIKAVYLLPGRQLKPIGLNVMSCKTTDDVTIVIQS